MFLEWGGRDHDDGLVAEVSVFSDVGGNTATDTLCRESPGPFQDLMEVVGSKNCPPLFVFFIFKFSCAKKTGCLVNGCGG